VKSSVEPFSALDRAQVLEFLNAVAAAFSSGDLAEVKAVSGFRKSLTTNAVSTILELSRSTSEFLPLVFNRWGILPFYQNLCRYHLATGIAATHIKVGEIAQILLRRAEQLFNRDAVLQIAGNVEERVLYPTVLVELLDRLRDVQSALTTLNSETRMLVAQKLNAQDSVAMDQILAANLGWAGPVVNNCPFLDEEHQTRTFIGLIRRVSAIVGVVMHWSNGASLQDDQVELEFARNQLADACTSLSNLQPPTQIASSEMWELYRLKYSECLLRLQTHLEQMNEKIDPIFQRIVVQRDGATAFGLERPLERKIVYQLVHNGVSYRSAKTVSEKLRTYVTQRQVEPRVLIDAELKALDPSLSETLVQSSLKSTEKDRSADTTQKDGLVKHLEALKSVFASFAPLLLAFFVVGCGLKTRPVSDIPEYRAPMPQPKSQIQDR
jgi:hypothetical protein